jgi:hypothetical protein
VNTGDDELCVVITLSTLTCASVLLLAYLLCYFKHNFKINFNQFEGAWGDAGPRHMPPPQMQHQQHNNAQAAHHQFMMEQQRRQVCMLLIYTIYSSHDRKSLSSVCTQTMCNTLYMCNRHVAWCLCVCIVLL